MLEIGVLSSLTFPVKGTNKQAVLDLIRFTPEGVSRAGIARRLGLSRSAITSIVNDLLSKNIIHEAEDGPATGGRRPILLEMNPQRGYVVGVDLGASHLGMVLSDYTARVLFEIEVPFNLAAGPEKCLLEVDQQLHNLLDDANLRFDQITALGVGVPGPVDIEAGSVSEPPIMPGWGQYPIRSYLSDLWGLPVVIGNDAEFGALGEWAYGAGRGESHVAYVKVGSGIGAGLLLGGNIYRGANGYAGEIGHITLDNKGPLCSCGNRGCLESFAGGAALAEQAKQAVRSGKRTRLSLIEPLESITARDVGEAARLGDLVSQQIVTEAGRYLGTAIASLVNLFNPHIVVVGGGVAQMGDLLLEPIRETVSRRSLQPSYHAVRIVSSVLGRRSTCMGAVVQALSQALLEIVEN